MALLDEGNEREKGDPEVRDEGTGLVIVGTTDIEE